jgi:hypothetical protein
MVRCLRKTGLSSSKVGLKVRGVSSHGKPGNTHVAAYREKEAGQINDAGNRGEGWSLTPLAP